MGASASLQRLPHSTLAQLCQSPHLVEALVLPRERRVVVDGVAYSCPQYLIESLAALPSGRRMRALRYQRDRGMLLLVRVQSGKSKGDLARARAAALDVGKSWQEVKRALGRRPFLRSAAGSPSDLTWAMAGRGISSRLRFEP